MSPEVAVLVNPTAGRGRHRAVAAGVAGRLERNGCVTRVLAADTAGAALAACRTAVESGVDALVTVGGDGTVHLGIQAVAGTPVPLGIVPTGTGNDIGSVAGLPAEPLAAADAIAAALPAGRTTTWDLARLTDADGGVRWYAGVLAAGFDAVVNARVNAMRWPHNRLRYDLATFLELVRLPVRAYTLTLDDVQVEVPAVLLAVGNSRQYGGGMRICPGADPTDGLVDVTVVRPVSRLTMVRVKPKVFTGEHVRHPAVDTYQARRVGIAAEQPLVTYADGERAFALPVTVTTVAGALNLLA